MSKYLISIVGPTGIGKTAMGIALSQRFNTDILSADSRQFFKEMSIGTAVPSDEELKSATHHFIQHKSIFEPYSVGDFEREAILWLDQWFKMHNTAIMVGGSGLYVDAVIKGLDTFPEVSFEIRERIQKLYLQKGITFLQEELKIRDPLHFSRVDIQNPQRMMRALEVCWASEKPYSSFLSHPQKARNFKVISIGIEAPRDIVYQRIETRVDQMMRMGLLQEAQRLFTYRHKNALQTVGYRELFSFLEGTHSLQTAISEIKKNTRRFAKRQFTWFKRNPNTHWFSYDTPPQTIYNFITNHYPSYE